ncbi:MAG: hypothetical protein AAF597_10810 [Bacteroidota bacterium]
MPYPTLLFILFLCTCGPAKLSAQPRTEPIQTERNLKPVIDAYQKRWVTLRKTNQFKAAELLEDSIQRKILGAYVTPSYLTDRHGNVWNLGVMELPFVLHTFFWECATCESYTAAINSAAKKYADEVVTFVLLPRPKNTTTWDKLDAFNEHVIVIFADAAHKANPEPTKSPLFGMIGYPTTYFITAARKIVGLDGPTLRYAFYNKQGSKVVFRKFSPNLTKTLRRQVNNLLALSQ